MAGQSLERDCKYVFLEIHKVWTFVAVPIPMGAN